MALLRKSIRSLISYTPIIRSLLEKTGTGGSNSAEYCHRMWRIHKALFVECGGDKHDVVAEIGPGDSVGSGICALLEGAEKYLAFDAINHTNPTFDISMLEDLVELFYKNSLNHLQEKIVDLKKDLGTSNHLRTRIKYFSPWWEFDEIEDNKIDFVFSTAVMEHIDDIDSFYRKVYGFLKPGGLISSLIDYSAHEFSEKWFEHYYYGDKFWKFLMHGRKYIINRRTHTEHLLSMKNSGFTIVKDDRRLDDKVNYRKISKSIRSRFEDLDLSTKSGIIVGKKVN